MTMSCAVPILRLLLCAAFLTSADATSRISSLLPHHILMNTSILVYNPPVKLDLLSVRWEHKGRTLVEYKDGNLTFYSPFVLMSLEQLKHGNISLVLTNLTLNDAGNYTCLVQYIGVEQTAVYHLIIERNRIRLLNLTPPPQKAGVSSVKSIKKGPLLHVEGEELVTAQLGNNVTLPCHFKMDNAIELSMLNVHWSKDGVTKYFSNKTCCDFPDHEISEEDLQNGFAPLQLIDVQDKDVGNYTCTIKYKAMKRSWITKFQIVKSTKVPPSFYISGNELVSAQPGKNVTLLCHVEMDNTIELSMVTVHWSKDGIPKYFSNKTCCDFPGHEISEDLESPFVSLQLIDVQEKDAGNYTCTIKYKAMEKSWITRFHIGTSTTTGEPTRTPTVTVPPPVVPQFRTLKVGLVLGALAVTGLVAAFVYICFDG